MKCPWCNDERLSDVDRFCPNCGSPVRSSVRIDIQQAIEQNLGRVVGLHADAIHGDVYSGDIYQIQVYALSDAGRGVSWHRFLQETTPPISSCLHSRCAISPYSRGVMRRFNRFYFRSGSWGW